MSIAPTRKVSGSAGATRKVEHSYTQGNSGEPFVEMIDTNNSVSIREDLRDNEGRSRQSYNQSEEQEDKPRISSGSTYIPSAIEALTASGVYEQPQPDNRHLKVGVYDNNQSIIKEEEDERSGQTYLKHLYENNTPIEEVDELA